MKVKHCIITGKNLRPLQVKLVLLRIKRRGKLSFQISYSTLCSTLIQVQCLNKRSYLSGLREGDIIVTIGERNMIGATLDRVSEQLEDECQRANKLRLCVCRCKKRRSSQGSQLDVARLKLLTSYLSRVVIDKNLNSIVNLDEQCTKSLADRPEDSGFSANSLLVSGDSSSMADSGCFDLAAENDEKTSKQVAGSVRSLRRQQSALDFANGLPIDARERRHEGGDAEAADRHVRRKRSFSCHLPLNDKEAQLKTAMSLSKRLFSSVSVYRVAAIDGCCYHRYHALVKTHKTNRPNVKYILSRQVPGNHREPSRSMVELLSPLKRDASQLPKLNKRTILPFFHAGLVHPEDQPLTQKGALTTAEAGESKSGGEPAVTQRRRRRLSREGPDVGDMASAAVMRDGLDQAWREIAEGRFGGTAPTPKQRRHVRLSTEGPKVVDLAATVGQGREADEMLAKVQTQAKLTQKDSELATATLAPKQLRRTPDKDSEFVSLTLGTAEKLSASDRFDDGQNEDELEQEQYDRTIVSIARRGSPILPGEDSLVVNFASTTVEDFTGETDSAQRRAELEQSQADAKAVSAANERDHLHPESEGPRVKDIPVVTAETLKEADILNNARAQTKTILEHFGTAPVLGVAMSGMVDRRRLSEGRVVPKLSGKDPSQDPSEPIRRIRSIDVLLDSGKAAALECRKKGSLVVGPSSRPDLGPDEDDVLVDHIKEDGDKAQILAVPERQAAERVHATLVPIASAVEDAESIEVEQSLDALPYVSGRRVVSQYVLGRLAPFPLVGTSSSLSDKVKQIVKAKCCESPKPDWSSNKRRQTAPSLPNGNQRHTTDLGHFSPLDWDQAEALDVSHLKDQIGSATEQALGVDVTTERREPSELPVRPRKQRPGFRGPYTSSPKKPRARSVKVLDIESPASHESWPTFRIINSGEEITSIEQADVDAAEVKLEEESNLVRLAQEGGTWKEERSFSSAESERTTRHAAGQESVVDSENRLPFFSAKHDAEKAGGQPFVFAAAERSRAPAELKRAAEIRGRPLFAAARKESVPEERAGRTGAKGLLPIPSSALRRVSQTYAVVSFEPVTGLRRARERTLLSADRRGTRAPFTRNIAFPREADSLSITSRGLPLYSTRYRGELSGPTLFYVGPYCGRSELCFLRLRNGHLLLVCKWNADVVLQSGDVVIEINGHSTERMSMRTLQTFLKNCCYYTLIVGYTCRTRAGRQFIRSSLVGGGYGAGSGLPFGNPFTGLAGLAGMGVPLRPGRSGGAMVAINETREREKRELSHLNDKFAQYVEKVRFLEAQNRKLHLELEALQSKAGQGSSRIKEMYEIEMQEARKLIDDTGKDKALAEVKAQNAETEANNFKKRYQEMLMTRGADRQQLDALEQDIAENEAKIHLLRRRLTDLEDEGRRYKAETQRLLGEISRLTNELQNEAFAKSSLETEKMALEDELQMLKQMHEAELNDLKTRTNIDVGLDPSQFFRNELANAIKEIRNEYELANEQQRNDLHNRYMMHYNELVLRHQKPELDPVQYEQQRIQEEKLRVSLTCARNEVSQMKSRNEELAQRIRDVQAMLDGEKEEGSRMLSIRDQELDDLRMKLEQLLKEYEEVSSMKTSLEKEISQYRELLEGTTSHDGLRQVVEHIEEEARRLESERGFESMAGASGVSSLSRIAGSATATNPINYGSRSVSSYTSSAIGQLSKSMGGTTSGGSSSTTVNTSYSKNYTSRDF